MTDEQHLEGPYSIGQNHWAGLARLVEELGELQAVLGKIMASGGKVRLVTAIKVRRTRVVHLPGDGVTGEDPDPYEVKIPEIVYYDKTKLLHALRCELADVKAAIDFFEMKNVGYLYSKTLSSEGLLVDGDYFMDERHGEKLAKYSEYHRKNFSIGDWVPVSSPQDPDHAREFIDCTIAQFGPAGSAVDRSIDRTAGAEVRAEAAEDIKACEAGRIKFNPSNPAHDQVSAAPRAGTAVSRQENVGKRKDADDAGQVHGMDGKPTGADQPADASGE